MDQKKPWTGPGRDPRADKFEDEDMEENPDADDGEDTYLDPSEY